MLKRSWMHSEKPDSWLNNMQTSKFEDLIAKDGYLIYRIKGDSMMPLIDQRRDLVTIKAVEGPCRRYDIVLYKRDSGQYVLHRILRKRKEDYVICGDNRWQLEYGITDKHILGVMTTLVRDGKPIQLSGWRYWLYVHLWCDLFLVRAGILWLKALPYRCRRWLMKNKQKNKQKNN